MASTKSLNAKNLAALGADQLAELLIEVSAGDAVIKRRLRLELAGAAGGAEVAGEVRKRLATIAKARSFVEWHKIGALVVDLETQHRAIVGHVAKADPGEAFDLLWRFMALAERVLARCDDSNGRVIDLFRAAMRDLAPLADAAGVEPRTLAQQVFHALRDNGHGQYDGLIELLAGQLGQEGLDHLKMLFIALSKAPPEPPRDEDRQVIGWGSGGPLYADQIEARRHESTIRLALRDIADAQGDVDGFIAQHSEQARRVPAIAAEIARRLLDTGRAVEAWEAINAIDEQRRGWIPFEWEQVRIDILEALGRSNEAQAFRWERFEQTLNGAHLRAYLKALPDFEDIDAEAQAMTHVLGYPDIHQALGFLIAWPDIDRANRLVLDRGDELNGDFYEILTPAADALDSRYPLAATIVRRAMIDFALEKARSKRYPHAARHLAECAGLACRIEDYGSIPTHDDYCRQLRSAHGRKTAFWQA